MPPIIEPQGTNICPCGQVWMYSDLCLVILGRWRAWDCRLQCSWVRRGRGGGYHHVPDPQPLPENILASKHGQRRKEDHWSGTVEGRGIRVRQDQGRHSRHCGARWGYDFLLQMLWSKCQCQQKFLPHYENRLVQIYPSLEWWEPILKDQSWGLCFLELSKNEPALVAWPKPWLHHFTFQCSSSMCWLKTAP